MNVIPGDPLAGLLSPDATTADRDSLAHSLGLDLPLPVQYANYVVHFAQGDLGQSFSRRRPVSELIGNAFGNTLLLASTAAVFGLLGGIGFGFLAAVRPGKWSDRAISLFSMIGLSVPSYWLGLLLIIIFSATPQCWPSTTRSWATWPRACGRWARPATCSVRTSRAATSGRGCCTAAACHC